MKNRWATKAWLVCVLNYCRGRPRAMRFTSSVLLHPTATAFWRRRHSGSSGRRSPQQQGRAWTRHDLKPGAARPRWPQLWHTRVLVHDKRQMRLRRRGTDGLLTHRWRKPDSNRRSPLKKGRALIYRAASRCRAWLIRRRGHSGTDRLRRIAKSLPVHRRLGVRSGLGYDRRSEWGYRVPLRDGRQHGRGRCLNPWGMSADRTGQPFAPGSLVAHPQRYPPSRRDMLPPSMPAARIALCVSPASS